MKQLAHTKFFDEYYDDDDCAWWYGKTRRNLYISTTSLCMKWSWKVEWHAFYMPFYIRKKKGEPALECNALDIKMLFLELYGLLPKFRKGATKT